MLDKAKKFAKLMDANKYSEAGSFLSEDCRYFYGQEVVSGRANILQTYISNYEKAAKRLDEIIFLSEVIELSNSKFKLCYLDKIRKGTVWHDHRCEQVIRFKDEKIVEIKHLDLPGEAESLQQFYKAVGL